MTAPDGDRTGTEDSADNPENAVLALIADVGNYSVTALARSKRFADDLGYDSLLQLRLLDRLRAEYPQLHGLTSPTCYRASTASVISSIRDGPVDKTA